MKTLTLACALLLLGATFSDAARLLGQNLQPYASDSADGPRRQLQALNQTQATCILKVVADLVGEVQTLKLGSQLDDAVDEGALAKFLVATLAGLGVSDDDINAVLVGGSIYTPPPKGTSVGKIVNSVVQALQTLLDQGSVTSALNPTLSALGGGVLDLGLTKGLSQLLDYKSVLKGVGLPLDDSTLGQVVDADGLNTALVKVVATVINDYVKLANTLSAAGATAGSTGSQASAQAAATTKSLVGTVTSLLG